MSSRPRDPWRRTLRVVTVVTVLTAVLIVLLVATACRDEPPPTSPTGTVESRVDTVLSDGRVRADLIVRYPDGSTAPVQLDGSTACVVGSEYPACAG